MYMYTAFIAQPEQRSWWKMCIYIYVYIHMYIYTYACICVQPSLHNLRNAYVGYLYSYICLYLYVHLYICMHMYTAFIKQSEKQSL